MLVNHTDKLSRLKHLSCLFFSCLLYPKRLWGVVSWESKPVVPIILDVEASLSVSLQSINKSIITMLPRTRYSTNFSPEISRINFMDRHALLGHKFSWFNIPTALRCLSQTCHTESMPISSKYGMENVEVGWSTRNFLLFLPPLRSKSIGSINFKHIPYSGIIIDSHTPPYWSLTIALTGTDMV